MKIPFHDKRFCFFIGFIITSIFSSINNYYYYNSLEKGAHNRQEEIFRIIKSSYDNCNLEYSKSYCKELITAVVKKSNIYGSTIISENDNVLYESFTHRYGLERKLIKNNYTLDDELDLELEVGQLVSPPLWLSTLRSMTFSINDWIGVLNGSQEPMDFIKRVAWPRSAPTIFAAFLVIIVLMIVRLHSISYINIQLSHKKKLRESLDALSSIEDEKKELTNRIKEKSYEIESNHLKYQQLKTALNKSKEELNIISSDREIEILNKEREIKDLEELVNDFSRYETSYSDEIKKLEGELSNIKKQLDVKTKELEDIQRNSTHMQLSKSQRKLLESILLESPDVNLSNGFKSEIGKHHSKDFIKKIEDQIKRNTKAASLIKNILPARYDSKKRGRAELFLEDKDKRSFYLIVYGKSDEGYAVKIGLSAINQWQAIAESKYILNTVSIISGVLLSDKTKL